MRVAVVGAGIGGLAVASFLLEKGANVTLFHQGPSASAASTGLLHSRPGRQARLSWRAEEGMEATRKLLQRAQIALGTEVFRESGILRFLREDGCRVGPSALNASSDQGKWIPDGITVFSRRYLEALKKICGGAEFVETRVTLDDLSSFDAAVIAAGAGSLEFKGCEELGLQKTIGQALLCRWKEPLSFSLLGFGHITPTEDPEFCQVGSTYEHTDQPDPKKALALLDQVALFYPPARDFQVVEIRHGVRVAPKGGYRPLARRWRDKIWIFSGFGSRGLLYHALLAKELVEDLLLSPL